VTSDAERGTTFTIDAAGDGMSRGQQILVVDDEANLRRMVAAVLVADGFRTVEAAMGTRRSRRSSAGVPTPCLLDLQMPGGPDGLATLERLTEDAPGLPVVMMSGRAGLQDAVRATKLGAYHFLEKPLAPETVLLTLRSALALAKARAERRHCARRWAHGDHRRRLAPDRRPARDQSPRSRALKRGVLVTGESGTGKELVAAAIHAASQRADRSPSCG